MWKVDVANNGSRVSAVLTDCTLRTHEEVTGTPARDVAILFNLKLRLARYALQFSASWHNHLSVLVDPALEAVLVDDEFAALGAAQHELLLLLGVLLLLSQRFDHVC